MDRREFLACLGWLIGGCDASLALAITTGDFGDMKLIEPLCIGFAAAPSGTATIYLAGTTTPATTYTGANATGSSTGTAGVYTLDSQGSIVLYVNQRVDVTIKSAGGATVRTFTVGDHAATTRYSGAGYTLTGGFTDVQTILAAASTSIGGTDWNLSNGRSIADVLAPVANYFSAKKYGALGNGVADDTAAIQAALSAAGASGNAVVVLDAGAGTYRVTSTLTVSGGTTILGQPSSGTYSYLYCSTAAYASPLISFNGAVKIYNVHLSHTGASATGPIIKGTDYTAQVFAYDCRITCRASNAAVLSTTGIEAYLYRTTVILLAAGSKLFDATLVASTLEFHDGRIDASAILLTSPMSNAYVTITRSTVLMSYASTIATSGRLVANDISGPGFMFSTTAVSYETANTVSGGMTLTSLTGFISYTTSSFANFATTTVGNSLTPNPANSGIQYLQISGAATVNAPVTVWPGATLDILIRNPTAGALGVTWDAIYKGAPAVTLGAGTNVRGVFRYATIIPAWAALGTLTPYA